MYELAGADNPSRDTGPPELSRKKAASKTKSKRRSLHTPRNNLLGIRWQDDIERGDSFTNSKKVEGLYDYLLGLCLCQKSLTVNDIVYGLKYYDFRINSNLNSKRGTVMKVRADIRSFDMCLASLLSVCSYVVGDGNFANNPVVLDFLRKKAVSLCDFAIIYLAVKGLDEEYIRTELQYLHAMKSKNKLGDDSIALIRYAEKINLVLANCKPHFEKITHATTFFTWDPEQLEKKITKRERHIEMVFRYVDVNNYTSNGDIDGRVSRNELADALDMIGLDVGQFGIEGEIVNFFDELETDDLGVREFAKLVIKLCCNYEPVLSAPGNKRREPLVEKLANVRYRFYLMHTSSKSSLTNHVFFVDRFIASFIRALLFPIADVYSWFRTCNAMSKTGSFGERFRLLFTQSGQYVCMSLYYVVCIWTIVECLGRDSEVKKDPTTNLQTHGRMQFYMAIIPYIYFQLYFSFLSGFPEKDAALTYLHFKIRRKLIQLKRSHCVVTEFATGNRSIKTVFHFFKKVGILSELHSEVAGEERSGSEESKTVLNRQFEKFMKPYRILMTLQAPFKIAIVADFMVWILATLFVPWALRSLLHCGKFGATSICQPDSPYGGCKIQDDLPDSYESMHTKNNTIFCVGEGAEGTYSSSQIYKEAPENDTTRTLRYVALVVFIWISMQCIGLPILNSLRTVQKSIEKLGHLMNPKLAMQFAARDDSDQFALPGYLQFRTPGNLKCWSEMRYFILLTLPEVLREASIFLSYQIISSILLLFAIMYAAVVNQHIVLLISMVGILVYFLKSTFSILFYFFLINNMFKSHVDQLKKTNLEHALENVDLQAHGGRTQRRFDELDEVLSDQVMGEIDALLKTMEATDHTHYLKALGVVEVDFIALRAIYLILGAVSAGVLSLNFNRLKILLPYVDFRRTLETIYDAFNPWEDEWGPK